MAPHSSRQGYREFHCEACHRTWKEATRDCYSHSCETCVCGEQVRLIASEPHPEWPLDKYGNLIK